jgi:phosphatidylglycerophosphate synthase
MPYRRLHYKAAEGAAKMTHASQLITKWHKNFGAPTQEFKAANRIQGSFLAAAEKRTLRWLAERTPGFINSDHLTALGLVAMALACGAYWLAARHSWALLLVNVCLALNWLGDSLDGTLARHRNLLRPRYGFYIDHLVDCLAALLLLGGMALSGYMQPGIAAALLVAYLLLSIECYLATYTMGSFQISYFKISPTELRILLAVGNVALLIHPQSHLFGHAFRLFDVGGWCGIAGMMFLLVLNSVRHAATLYREERIG